MIASLRAGHPVTHGRCFITSSPLAGKIRLSADEVGGAVAGNKGNYWSLPASKGLTGRSERGTPGTTAVPRSVGPDEANSERRSQVRHDL